MTISKTGDCNLIFSHTLRFTILLIRSMSVACTGFNKKSSAPFAKHLQGVAQKESVGRKGGGVPNYPHNSYATSYTTAWCLVVADMFAKSRDSMHKRKHTAEGGLK